MGRRLAGATLAGVAVVYLLGAWLACPDLGFWSPDSSIRYVQVVSLLRQNYRDVAAVYPGAQLDPGARFYAVSSGFATVRDGKVYLLYSPYFPALVAPLYWVLGRFGLVVLPLLSGLAVVSVTYLWLRRSGPGTGVLGAGLVGLGTPLVVYSVVFWDHAPVAALTTAAAWLLCRSVEDRTGSLLAAGVVLGVATWFRNEAYLFAAAAMAAWGAVAGLGRLPRLVVGFLLGAGLAWALNWQLYGHPLGLKGLAGIEAVRGRLGGAEGWLLRRVLAAYDLLISTERFVDAQAPVRVGTSAGVATVLVLSALLFRAGACSRSVLSLLSAGAAVATVTVWLLGTGSEVMGLLPAVPAVALLGLWKPETAWERVVGWTAGLYVLGVLVVSSEGGLQWGPRYLLPAVPLLMWLGCVALSRWCGAVEGRLRGALVTSTALLALAGLTVQGVGVMTVRWQAQAYDRVERLLRSIDSSVVATGIEPLFRVMGYLYFERVLMTVQGPEELRQLVDLLAARQVRRWAYIPVAGPAFDARVVERWAESGRWRFRVAEDRMLHVRIVQTRSTSGLRVITYTGSR
ncbi:MAG: hypothetical protein QN144_14415 [Armatimonadota bacterium]|nr:hypothetical protein [Armatimonadota bacterium]